MWTRLRTSTCRHPIRSYILLTFTVSYGVGMPVLLTHALWSARISEPLATYASRSLVVLGPALAAAMVSLMCAGPQALYALLTSLCLGRGYWSSSMLFPLLGAGVAVTGLILAGAEGTALASAVAAHWPGLLLHYAMQILLVGCGEEVGWRGWLLPNLLARFNRLIATVTVGAIWAVWHLPVLLSGLRLGAAFVCGTLGLSCLFTWIWSKSDRSVLAVAIAHGCVNTPVFFLEQFGNPNKLPADLLRSGWEAALWIYAFAGAALVVARWNWWMGHEQSIQQT